MRDTVGRTVRYLRLSITSGCNQRCLYCRPPAREASAVAPLTASEIETLVRHLVEKHALKKVRLTGGEPTGRPDLIEIVSRLGRIAGLDELCMTTNGLTLARDAKALADAGVRRLNVSLDSLVPEKYQRITGVDGLQQVLQGIEAAIAAGLSPVKLNTVVIRGENDHELCDLLLFAAWKKLEIRFIELMPIGPLARRWDQLFVPESEMRQRLSDIVTSWVATRDTTDPARRYYAGLTYGRGARVGFITPMSCPFCSTCDRIRIASDGSFLPCLMDEPIGSVITALRPAFDSAALDRILTAGLAHKAPEHPATDKESMVEIGG